MNPTKLRTLRTVLLPYLAWDGPEFPQNTPSPTLKCCGGVKNHLRLATTGTLRSQLLPKTSRAHLPTSLLESPSFVPNPSLLPAPGTNCSGDLSRPSLPSFLPPSLLPINLLHYPDPRSEPPANMATEEKEIGQLALPPLLTESPSPSPSSGCSCHGPLRARASAAFELPLPLCLKIRDKAPTFPDRLPCSIMAVPILNGSSLVHGLPVRNADGALQITPSTTRTP